MSDQRRSRQQLKALLLRLGYYYSGKSSWTEAHLRYLRELKMAHPAQKVVLEEYLIALSQAGERIARLNGQIELQVATWSWRRSPNRTEWPWRPSGWRQRLDDM